MAWEDTVLASLQVRDAQEAPPAYFNAFQQLYAQLHGSGGASGFKDTVRFQELYRTQGEQLQQTRATVERLNDELVALEIENNLLQSRVDQLEAENAGLVERWLARVQQEVDGLNLKNG